MLAVSACGATGTPAAPATKPANSPAATPAPAATASSSPAASTAPAAGKIKVTYLLGYFPSSYDAPAYVAKAKGYFAQHGLDVTIEPGRGSGVTVAQVANGSADFGFSDAFSVAKTDDEGAQLKMVADYLQKSPDAVLYHLDKPLAKPTDLYGQTLAVTPGSGTLLLWPTFVKDNHLDVKRINIVNSTSTAMPTLFLDGKIDDYLAFSLQVPNLEAAGGKAGALYFADWGVTSLANGVFTTDRMISQHPAEVRDFVAAFDQGWQFARQNPAAAIALERQADPQLAKGSTAALKITLGLLHTPRSKGHPVGWMSTRDWQDTLAILPGGAKYPASHYFTDQFIPAS